MDAEDIACRNATYERFVKTGRAPTVDEIAASLSWTADAVKNCWQRLHDAHALVLTKNDQSIRMLNPFATSPTLYEVTAAGRSWFGNCAWDAIGICAALHTDGRIDTVCRDCDQPLTIHVRQRGVDQPDLLFHCLVPAAHWWDDIVFT